MKKSQSKCSAVFAARGRLAECAHDEGHNGPHSEVIDPPGRIRMTWTDDAIGASYRREMISGMRITSKGSAMVRLMMATDLGVTELTEVCKWLSANPADAALLISGPA